MKTIEKLILQNKAWAQERRLNDPEFFERQQHSQKPHTLWIGCSDSRIPPDLITDTDPGSMFVHRNIANLVVHTDLNSLSVIQYAVEALEVQHVIVCGHYGCGGVNAAMKEQDLGLLNGWLANIREVYHHHRPELSQIPDEAERWQRLVEHTTRAQVHNLMKTAIIQRSWAKRKAPSLHAWVYQLQSGELKVLETIPAGSGIDPEYRLFPELGGA